MHSTSAWEPGFTSTRRIGCCKPSSGTQQAPARQRGGTRGKMCSASSFLPDLLHFSNWFSAPSSLLLSLARACCVPELGRQQLILSVDVNLGLVCVAWSVSRCLCAYKVNELHRPYRRVHCAGDARSFIDASFRRTIWHLTAAAALNSSNGEKH